MKSFKKFTFTTCNCHKSAGETIIGKASKGKTKETLKKEAKLTLPPF